MRGAELSPERLVGQLHLRAGTPGSFSAEPTTSAPYPPLVSGGWYQGVEQEVAGPGRYPMARPAEKSAVAAVLWVLFFGPLGLCYLSVAGGLIAAAATVVVIMAGGGLTLAIIWPIAIVSAVLAVRRQRPGRRQRSGRRHRVVRSGAGRPDRDPATANAWFLSNV
jgi:hypothetical protein